MGSSFVRSRLSFCSTVKKRRKQARGEAAQSRPPRIDSQSTGWK
jgi:hypothetical protein